MATVWSTARISTSLRLSLPSFLSFFFLTYQGYSWECLKYPGSYSDLQGFFITHFCDFRYSLMVACFNTQAGRYMGPEWQLLVDIVARFMVVLNSSINFIIYCAAGKQFRSILAGILNIKTGQVLKIFFFFSTYLTDQIPSGFNLGIRAILYFKLWLTFWNEEINAFLSFFIRFYQFFYDQFIQWIPKIYFFDSEY